MVARVTVDLTDIVKRTQRKLQTVAHEVTQDIALTAIDRTPVVTGNLKGHWFTSINDVNVSFDGEPDKDGAATIARVSFGISQSGIGDVINVLNGASYAQHVEFGTSRMAPRSFVRSTVNDAPQIAEQTVRRIART